MAQTQNEGAAQGCMECGDVITNPICPDCLSGRIREWISELNPKLGNDIVGFDFSGPTKCLFCGNGMSICAHCYSRDIYEQLRAKNSKIAQEFLARFDFDLRRELVV